MLKGNRLLVAALGTVTVVTVAIAWWTFPVSPTTQQFRYDDPRNENYQPGGSECQPSSLAAISDAKVRLRKADDCAEKAEEYRQASDDLIQQTRAANAAQAQADIANQQLWTGWLQTLGGFLTLCAAIAAAVYARDAAKEGRRAADEAEGNHMSYIASERAILHAIGGKVGELSITKRETVTIEIINRGRTAARVVRIGATSIDGPQIENTSRRWTTIGAGETAFVAAFDPPQRHEIAKVNCWVEYTSIGQQTHKTYFTVTVEWYSPQARDYVYAMAGWDVDVTNYNGHPDDT